MTDFIVKKLPYDLSSQAGLALVGQYLKRINSQRMDSHAPHWFDLVSDLNTALLGNRINAQPIDFGQLPCSYTTAR